MGLLAPCISHINGGEANNPPLQPGGVATGLAVLCCLLRLSTNSWH